MLSSPQSNADRPVEPAPAPERGDLRAAAISGRTPQCSVSDLMVLDVNVARAANAGKHFDHIFKAESCARILYVGSRAEVEAAQAERAYLPRKALVGEEAYRYLLEVAVGLHSEKTGEEHVLGQLQDRWKKFEDGCDRVPSIHRAMEHLISDAKHIRTVILSHRRPPRKFGAVRELLKLTGGESILLVAAGEKLTKEAAWVLGGSSRRAASKLILTHPDYGQLKLRVRELEQEISERRVFATFSSLRFGELAASRLECDHAVVCQAMASEPGPRMAVDKLLIDFWSSYARSHSESRLVHVAAASTAEHWRALLGPNFIAPEEVKSTLSDSWNKYRAVLEQARKACAYLAEVRAADRKIHYKNQVFDVPT